MLKHLILIQSVYPIFPQTGYKALKMRDRVETESEQVPQNNLFIIHYLLLFIHSFFIYSAKRAMDTSTREAAEI